jgi:putative FmdB family regulatory protein
LPTYDYRCKKCNHTWETFQSIKAEPTKKCPECGKNAAERVIGPGAAVIFKGSGFYQTDYRSESYKKAAEADKPASSTKSEGSSSSSPAPAAEKKSDSKKKAE